MQIMHWNYECVNIFFSNFLYFLYYYCYKSCIIIIILYNILLKIASMYITFICSKLFIKTDFANISCHKDIAKKLGMLIFFYGCNYNNIEETTSTLSCRIRHEFKL